MIFMLVLTKSFSHNIAIWPDAEDISTSSKWKALHVFAVIWIFSSVPEKLLSCCLIETSQSSKYCLAKDHWLFVSSFKVSAISGGMCWNMWQNAHYIKSKIAINMQIFAVDAEHSLKCWVVYIVIVMQTVELKLMQLN